MQESNAEERREKDQTRGSGNKSVITMLCRRDEEEFYLGEGTVRKLESADGFNKPVLFARDYKRGGTTKSHSAEVMSTDSVRVEVVESVHTESLGEFNIFSVRC